MVKETKNCPLCGEQPKTNFTALGNTSYPRIQFSIQCLNGHTVYVGAFGDSEAEARSTALKKWNARA